VVWNPQRRQSLAASALHMNVDHSPYEDVTVAGWPDLVLSRGDSVARDGDLRRRNPPAAGYVSRTPNLT